MSIDLKRYESSLEAMLRDNYTRSPYADVYKKTFLKDLTNEPITNNLINDLLPDYNTHLHWFKLADSTRRAYGKEEVISTSLY